MMTLKVMMTITAQPMTVFYVSSDEVAISWGTSSTVSEGASVVVAAGIDSYLRSCKSIAITISKNKTKCYTFTVNFTDFFKGKGSGFDLTHLK